MATAYEDYSNWVLEGMGLVGYEFSRFDWYRDPCLNAIIETGVDIVQRFYTIGYDTCGAVFMGDCWYVYPLYFNIDFTPLFN